MLESRLEFEFTHVLWSHDHSGPEDNFAVVADDEVAKPHHFIPFQSAPERRLSRVLLV